MQKETNNMIIWYDNNKWVSRLFCCLLRLLRTSADKLKTKGLNGNISAPLSYLTVWWVKAAKLEMRTCSQLQIDLFEFQSDAANRFSSPFPDPQTSSWKKLAFTSNTSWVAPASCAVGTLLLMDRWMREEENQTYPCHHGDHYGMHRFCW